MKGERNKNNDTLLLLLSCFSCVWLCATPWTAAHQAPLSLGFSRQGYWNGLPFPSPMHACMLSCFSRVQLDVTLWTAAHQAPLSTGFSRQEYWSGTHPTLKKVGEGEDRKLKVDGRKWKTRISETETKKQKRKWKPFLWKDLTKQRWE